MGSLLQGGSVNLIIPGSQSCSTPCCGEADIVLTLTGISLVDGPSANLAGCTVAVMNEMNAVLAADITLSFQAGSNCQWTFSYLPPSHVGAFDKLNVVVNSSFIRLYYSISGSFSPEIRINGTWDCDTWTPSGSWSHVAGSGSGDDCFNWSYGSASESIALA